MSNWTLVFMDENNYIFHREPLEANTPLPQSPTWNLNENSAFDVKQFLEIPNWRGDFGDSRTVYHTIIDYVNKQFVVSVHGIYGDTRK